MGNEWKLMEIRPNLMSSALRLVAVPLATKFGAAPKRPLMPQPLWSAAAWRHGHVVGFQSQ